jgi:ABC-type multidrug transport system ATPase subunit
MSDFEVLGKFENLTKSFNNTKALNGLSFKIHRGINGLIGPNGAGKTTTIKLILGLIKADSGRAEMFEFDCWKQSLQIRRQIGVLYEKVAFYEHLTGLEHLKLMAKLKGLQDPLGESEQALRLVELDREAQNKRISGYSAGMRQRIGLAHALLGKPQLVILDEPTSNLDPLGRARVIEIIGSLKKQGFSFLISSHILPELEQVCEHIVLINKGAAIRQGKLTQLLGEVLPQVFVIKAQPPEPLATLMRNEESVKEITMNEGSLLVVAKDAVTFKQRLPVLAAQAKAALEEVKVAGKDLESLFKVAVRED